MSAVPQLSMSSLTHWEVSTIRHQRPVLARDLAVGHDAGTVAIGAVVVTGFGDAIDRDRGGLETDARGSGGQNDPSRHHTPTPFTPAVPVPILLPPTPSLPSPP